MLLAENVEGLLPDWAFFVRAVIDTSELRPTASREERDRYRHPCQVHRSINRREVCGVDRPWLSRSETQDGHDAFADLPDA